jgi:hypothetical protein
MDCASTEFGTNRNGTSAREITNTVITDAIVF